MTLINNSYQFVFVHIPKNGGTTINNTLRPFRHIQDLELSPHFQMRGIGPTYRTAYGVHKHTPAAAIKKAMGGDTHWRKYFSFALARNPFTRTVSTFAFLKAWLPEKAGNEGPLGRLATLFETFSDVNDMVESDYWLNDKGHDQVFLPQSWWVTENGRTIVSYVGRVEDMAGSLRHIARECRLPRLGTSHANQSGADMNLGTVAAERIRERYHEDFERFGYSDDLGAVTCAPSVGAEESGTRSIRIRARLGALRRLAAR